MSIGRNERISGLSADGDRRVGGSQASRSGFQGSPSAIRLKLRKDARAALVLAAVIVGATAMVLGAGHVETLQAAFGDFLGTSLHATESAY